MQRWLKTPLNFTTYYRKRSKPLKSLKYDRYQFKFCLISIYKTKIKSISLPFGSYDARQTHTDRHVKLLTHRPICVGGWYNLFDRFQYFSHTKKNTFGHYNQYLQGVDFIGKVKYLSACIGIGFIALQWDSILSDRRA